MATAGDDGLAVVWDAATERRSPGCSTASAVTSVAFGPTGSIVTASDDDTARVWRPFARRVKPVVLRGHQREVVDAEFSPDGARVVTASFDGTARVWDARTGKELTVPFAHATPSPRPASAPTARASSPRAPTRPPGSGTPAAGRRSTSSPGQARSLRCSAVTTATCGSATFSPDGQRVVTSSFDTTARVWDATVDEPLSTLGGDELQVADAALSPDGKWLLTTPTIGDPQVLMGATGEVVSTLRMRGARVVSALFSSDGREAITTDSVGGLRIWDADTGELRSSRKLQGKPVLAVPSPDAAHIASVSVDDASDPATTTVALWGRTRPEPTATWHVEGRGEGVSFDAGGSRLLVWTRDGGVVVWDVRSGRRLAAFSYPELRSAALSPDGAQVVSAGTDRTARIRDVASGQDTQGRAPFHRLAIVEASFSADGGRLLTASRDTTAKIWDARSGVELVSLRGHENELTGARFDPNDRWVVTASLDRTARIWDAQTGQELARFRHPFEVLAATLDRDGRHVLTVDNNGRARVFRCETCVPLGELVRLARSRLLTRPE